MSRFVNHRLFVFAEYETYTLPDAYQGKNIFIRDTIEGFLDTTNNWYTTVCLPVQVTDQIHMTWNEFRFDQALASIVPEEGISRLITSSKEAREDHTIRHGLAFVLEHGFMTTDEGRRQYLLNIQQIAQSVQETNNYDVISAVLNCREYEREWEKRHSMIRTPWNELGKREVMEFAIVQKDFRGFEILHEKYKSRLSRYGVSPSMWIFPPGLALYATFSPTVADYSKETPGVELATGPEALGSFRGVNVYETREFDVRQGELPINLLQRRVQIGEHYYMRNHHSDNARYNTNTSMDIVVYNEDRDDWEKVSFRDAMNHVHRFRADGSLNNDNWGTDAPAGDLFSYKTTDFKDDPSHSWCDVFGEMEDDHLSAEALRAFCESVEAQHLAAVAAGAGAINLGGLGDINEAAAGGAPFLVGAIGAVSTLVVGTAGLVAVADADIEQAVMGRPKLYTKGAGDRGAVGDANDAQAKLSAKIQAALADLRLHGGSGPGGNFIPAEDRALAEFLGRNPVRASEVASITKTAKYQELLAGGTALESFTPSGTYLNRGSILGAANALYVFLAHEYVDVTDASHRTQLLDMCVPFKTAAPINGLVAPGGGVAPINSQFEAVGAKRSGDSSQNPVWKRRVTGVADFADSFAPVGANAGAGSYNYPGAAAANAADDGGHAYSSLIQGLIVNDKHERFAEKVATLATDLQVAIARVFYVTRVRGDVIAYWMNKNFVLPFSLIVARPHMTYDMCTCVMMKGGSDTGATFQGHSDFQLGDDVQSKIHYGNYTYYSKAIVTNHKNIILARNVMANGYVSGDGCSWKNSSGGGDMYAFLVPYDEYKKANPLRIFSVNRDDAARSMTGALYYARLHDRTSLPSDTKFTTLSEQEDSNDICYSGHHFWWKPHREQNASGTAGSYTGVSVNTGHWGDRVYPGCGRVRAGDEVYLKEISYGQEVF